MGPVERYLEVTLTDAKDWLRLDDDLEAALTIATPAEGLVHTISSIAGLRAGRWVTISGVDVKIIHVDFGTNAIVVDRPASINILTIGTPVTYHHQNGILMNAIQSGKGKADAYVNNSFLTMALVGGVLTPVVSIPSEVREWVLSYVALMYEKPEATLVSDSLREIGSRRFENELLYTGLTHLRRIPL